ncbi:hypothetical protein CNEO4_1220041 [Clostridium neonatale]|nr:hypothetical protein CNEO_360001 [Clostridium neonatale]CAI3563020.1 hypothetical protein CNEO4_1220041 [Clostridium neonatale]CAI3576772.1 hypothetical protein CNEO4_1270075 [Clostridium neonatale]
MIKICQIIIIFADLIFFYEKREGILKLLIMNRPQKVRPKI